MNTHVWILLFIAAFAICYSDAFNIEIAPVARRSFKRGTGQNSDKSDNDGQIFFGQTFSGNVIQLYREKYVT